MNQSINGFHLHGSTILPIPQNGFSQTEGKLYQGWVCVVLGCSLSCDRYGGFTAQILLPVMLADSPLSSSPLGIPQLQRAILPKVMSFEGWPTPSDWLMCRIKTWSSGPHLGQGWKISLAPESLMQFA